LKRVEEKTKKPQNPPKGLTKLKSFAVPEPLNLLSLKTRIINPEGDNKIFSFHLLNNNILFFNK
jgi:hypothetical protein